jgi:hypothetical protein
LVREDTGERVDVRAPMPAELAAVCERLYGEAERARWA